MKPGVCAVPTGISLLDEALNGGLPPGSLVLLEGEAGTGSTEFACSVAHAALGRGKGARATFLSALRSEPRVGREAREILGEKFAAALSVRTPTQSLEEDAIFALGDAGPGDVVVVESASALESAGDRAVLARAVRTLGDAAEASGALLALLLSPGTLSREAESGLREAADSVLSFVWRDNGISRRRHLSVLKLRGLGPLLEAEQVPVFEVVVRRGSGIEIGRVRNVI